MKLPRLLNPKEIPGPGLWNELVRYVTAITPRSSSDIMVRTTSGGTTFEQKRANRGGGGAAASGGGKDDIYCYIDFPEQNRTYTLVYQSAEEMYFTDITFTYEQDGVQIAPVIFELKVDGGTYFTGNSQTGNTGSIYFTEGQTLTLVFTSMPSNVDAFALRMKSAL